MEGRLEKLKDSIEIMALKDEIMQLISKVRVSRESIKFTVPIHDFLFLKPQS